MGNLMTGFKRAGLTVEVTRRPIVGLRGPAATQIVQMDIGGKTPDAPERFRIFRGHWKNRMQVLGVDRKARQLVLFVDEPAREFEEMSWVGRRKTTHTRRTDAQKRHFLLGMDESHLFISQLPRPATTVREAHALLEGEVVARARAGARKVIRQGEWFFLTPSAHELEALEEALASKRAVVQRKVPVGPVVSASVWGPNFRPRAGNPHTVDEVVSVAATEEDGERLVFARGKVRHVEHKTVALRDWMKVVRNSEAGPGTSVAWVD